ncbi:MAG: alpha-glucan family phosphorylase [Candidatus Pacearchaeota archaeon]
MIKQYFFDFNKLKIAYFSMEIGVESKIPTYSGGLGVLAGDMLRSSADLNLPVIGVTLLYKKGYFKQKIDSGGNQLEEIETWSPENYLIKLPNRVSVSLNGRDVFVDCWLYEIKGIKGTVNPIIFLDTDLNENEEQDREITKKLYGEGEDYRILQEAVLGIGGFRMVENLGCSIEKYHMNEGHSAFLTLEIYKKSSGDKLEETRKRCVFTTHTPVPAGHDEFSKDIVERVLQNNIPSEIKEQIFFDDKLNMTYLGLKFSGHINGVAKKHEEISKKMFPDYHIESITNGVHSVFWTSEYFASLFDKYIPNWREDSFNLRYVMSVPKEKIWVAHIKSKKKMIDWINKKYSLQMDTKTFTIGFARRATGYKRWELLLSDLNRLKEIAGKFEGIQIVYAGKAHPRDTEGKEVIKRILQKSRDLGAKIKFCFIENYNIDVAKKLVCGVDLWLNTPLRPKEASGTSGMKAAHNGVPQFSVLDGWWLEGHIENVTGWSIGPNPDDEQQADLDKKELEDLYSKLEYVILPTYYESRDDWIGIMRHTISINASFFNTDRMVQQYVSNAYFK